MHRIATFRLIRAQQLSQLEERMQAYHAAGPDFPVFHAPCACTLKPCRALR